MGIAHVIEDIVTTISDIGWPAYLIGVAVIMLCLNIFVGRIKRRLSAAEQAPSFVINFNNEEPTPGLPPLLIPALGDLGTASTLQLDAVSELIGSAENPYLSKEQATLILDARDYADVVLAKIVSGGTKVDIATYSQILVSYIFANPDILKAVSKWGRAEWDREKTGKLPRVPKNKHFNDVLEYARSRAA